MNVYSFRFPYGKTGGFVAGDASAAYRLCQRFGHLWLYGKGDSRKEALPNVLTGAAATNPEVVDGLKDSSANTTDFAVTAIDFKTKFRLPSTIDVPDSEGWSNAGPSRFGLGSEDTAYNQRMNNAEGPILVAGNLVVAITLGGKDVSGQLTTQLTFPVGIDAGGLQRLFIGIAAASAQDGVYDTPFSDALAWACFRTSTGQATNAPIVVTEGSYATRGQQMLTRG